MIRSPTTDSTTTTVNSAKRGRPNDSFGSDELMSFATPPQPSQPMTLDALFSAMNSKFDLTLRRIEESNASIATKIDTVKAELEGKLDAVTREINNFKGECATKFQSNEVALSGLCEQVNEIRQEMGGLEKRDELIVSGIPYLPEENLVKYFKAMWKEVGLSESSTPLIDTRRLKSGTNGDGVVLLQFALRNNRDDFYSNYLKNCNLKLSHLGINSTHRIYVNENLTVAARKLKVAALRLKKDGRLTTVYTKLGTVYVKRAAGEAAVAVRSEEHLHRL